ncbi:MAG TPA: Flp pilus assembly protein CpaB [Phenylobacterium sp.]|nr:Flp pilus assembly protein CpaB [Phenylobacterium sp.]
MGAVRIAIIALAALAAILLAFMVRGMVSPKKAAPAAAVAIAPPPKPMAQVLVAGRDLPVGTRLSPVDLAWQAWPVEALNPTFITDGAAPAPPPQGAEKVAKKAARATQDLVMSQGPMQAFDGAIVKDALAKGEPVTARKVLRAGDSNFMAVVLLPGMRAMSIPINAETAAGGFILPGDRVDVLQSRPGAEGKGFVTETLMRNLRVLAIDQKPEADKDAKSIVGAVAVLEVPAADTLVLARGKAQGEMQIVLRSYADLGGGAGRGGARGNTGMKLYRGGQAMEVVGR